MIISWNASFPHISLAVPVFPSIVSHSVIFGCSYGVNGDLSGFLVFLNVTYDLWMSSVFFSYTFLSPFLPVSHKYCNVLLCPDAEDSNLATTLWILQLNQPIREQLNQELELSTPTPAAAIQKSEVMTWIWFYIYDEFLLLPPCVPPLHLQNVSIHSFFIFLFSLPQSLSVVQLLLIQNVWMHNTKK